MITVTGRDYRETWWDLLIWLRCHVLRRHALQAAHESRHMVPLFDRRNRSFYEWRKNGRLECSGCKRDLGPDPDGVGAWF